MTDNTAYLLFFKKGKSILFRFVNGKNKYRCSADCNIVGEGAFGKTPAKGFGCIDRVSAGH